MKVYTPTIGIEVHAELKTKSKMFCGCPNAPHESEPNSNVCPVCTAEPGTLPVVNREAVHSVLKVGVAIGGKIADFTEFDRKNYFYPDIPKGYQISQYKFPLVQGGRLAGVDITRVHLEEDTARSQHEGGERSLVDFNRAGVPLMELVTEPVIHDAETAGKFAKELQLLLRSLGVSDANLEKGEMRIEANISISDTDTFGTKVEVKNLNSFRSVVSAISYEIARQEDVLNEGGVVKQETRGWDEIRGETFSQRSKESAEEYRYFPEPDIPKLDISKIPEWNVSRIYENLPDIPEKKREKYRNLGLPSKQIEQYIEDVHIGSYFEKALSLIGLENVEKVRTCANYLSSDIVPLVFGKELHEWSDSSVQFVELVDMINEGAITSRVAKDILPKVLFEKVHPREEVDRLGLTQQNDEGALLSAVREVIVANEKVVTDYKSGKTQVLQFLVGQGMKATKGSANPGVLANLFVRELAE